jgi:hypothetical protein
MKKLFTWLVILVISINAVKARTKTSLKIDTTKAKLTLIRPVKSDTTKNKTPAILQTNKFGKIDSADVKLKGRGLIEKFGSVDTADLKLTSCDFEKDANAEVLFDRAELFCGNQSIVMIRQKRIKIFNDNGKSEANVRIEFNNKFGIEHILAVEAETINLDNGKIVFTPIDIKLIYSEHTDKDKDAIVFSMPSVRTGSIIEYRYEWERSFSTNFPEWDFQSNLPERYSLIDVFMSPYLTFNALFRKNQPFVKDTISDGGYGHVWALANVPSAKDEPYMRSAVDALQSTTLVLSEVKTGGGTVTLSDSWARIGKQITDEKVFSKPYYQNLNDDGEVVKKAKALKSDDKKIAFIFNQVKIQMKWNDEKYWLSKDGIKSAWKKKSGNWGEINMILCHFLVGAGIKAYPLLVSTRNNGRMLPDFANIYQINKLVAYIPVDSDKCFVLDASDKYSIYNEIPFDLLNSYGLFLDKAKEKYNLILLKKDVPVRQAVFINAEIKPDGTMNGTAQINSFSYHKSNSLELYKTLDEKKYIDILRDNDNNLKITSLKFENADIDSLPLTQNINFNLDLPGTDDKYIYFNPNLFTLLYHNPFVNKSRVSDIDFGCMNNYSINGRYKIPAGYRIESLPKNMFIVIADKSMSFKRFAAEEDGYIVISYVISYKKSLYLKDDYPDIYAYFKKMHEILNEQIVLKKA